MAGLKQAVQLGADVNASDQFGQTVLVWAAYTGTTEMAELLIDAGADPNLGRNPPLHYAARFGRSAMVQVIIQTYLFGPRHTMLTGFDASLVMNANVLLLLLLHNLWFFLTCTTKPFHRLCWPAGRTLCWPTRRTRRL